MQQNNEGTLVNPWFVSDSLCRSATLSVGFQEIPSRQSEIRGGWRLYLGIKKISNPLLTQPCCHNPERDFKKFSWALTSIFGVRTQNADQQSASSSKASSFRDICWRQPSLSFPAQRRCNAVRRDLSRDCHLNYSSLALPTCHDVRQPTATYEAKYPSYFWGGKDKIWSSVCSRQAAAVELHTDVNIW